MAQSRRRKLVLLLVLLPILLIVLGVGLLLTPAVQTFAARRVLVDQGGTVERVALGFGGAEVRGLRVERPGLSLVVPSLSADLPLLGLARGTVELRSLVARDIVIELDPALLATPAEPRERRTRQPGKPFNGVLEGMDLSGISVEGVDVAGRVRVAGAQPLEGSFALAGGGIRAGQAGQVELKVEAKAGVGSVVTTFSLSPSLDAAGRVDALRGAAEAFATSKFLAQPARLRATADIAREGAGETYALRLFAAETPLVELDTRWAPGVAELPGRWKIAIRDEDLAPFVLGFALPELRVAGGGDLAVVGEDKLRVAGDLDLEADGLETLGLPKLGPVAMVAKFAVEAGSAAARVESLAVDVRGASPVLSLRTSQPFTLALDTRQITPARPEADLAEARLLGVPAEWIQLFAPAGLQVAGPLSGAWLARPEGDGVRLVSSEPFVAGGVSYLSEGKPLVVFDTVRVEELRAVYTTAGMEARVAGLRVATGGVELVSAAVEASQPAGAPLRAKGELRADLAKLADQPVLRGQTRLSAGQARVTFEATLAEALAATTRVRLEGLRAAGADLPELALEAELARDAAGVLTARAPITVRNVRANRGSDLLVDAVLRPGTDTTHLTARVSSQLLFVEDLQAFAAVAAETAPAPGRAPEPAPPAEGPPWAGFSGEVELDLARVVYAPGIEVVNTKGRFALDPEAAVLERLQAALGTGGNFDVSGALRWQAPERRYQLAAEVRGRDVAVGPLLRAINPREQPKLEGRYELSASVAGLGVDPATAARTAAADIRLSGRQGVVRAIDLDTSRFGRATGVVSGVAGIAGALGGNNVVTQRANQVAAFNNVARSFGNLGYDEITLEARRGPDGSFAIGNLLLASPQLRLSGGGGLRAVPGRSFMEMPLSLRLELSARGEFARYLGVLRLVQPTQNGEEEFVVMPDPLVFDGTLGQVGTSQITRLMTRAIGL